MGVRNYRDLIAWQKGIDLVEQVYVATRQFPRDELYGLTSQIRRAAFRSLPILRREQGRFTTGEFLHQLSVGHGSLCEVETQIIIAGRLHFLREAEVTGVLGLAAEVGRLINGLANSLGRQ
jgi:four helix bundle protein